MTNKNSSKAICEELEKITNGMLNNFIEQQGKPPEKIEITLNERKAFQLQKYNLEAEIDMFVNQYNYYPNQIEILLEGRSQSSIWIRRIYKQLKVQF
ncbi:hypothetical protein WMI_02148 [Enterococcus faecalis EnGen0363]|nr:hypothetical protein [Enterococcus faecalis]EJI7260795.1 hypothetical protein [Enterococcus faecalis]EOJ53978.1 hypothetical protein WMI_02148 [Enterococcus faecalis EnGen0363]PQF91004.1 hypothetical protein CUS49_09680 [Enterococcus faecalis]HCW2817639.1 hypothetical protein [Enterococcus faecalis]